MEIVRQNHILNDTICSIVYSTKVTSVHFSDLLFHELTKSQIQVVKFLLVTAICILYYYIMLLERIYIVNQTIANITIRNTNKFNTFLKWL